MSNGLRVASNALVQERHKKMRPEYVDAVSTKSRVQ